MSSITGCTWLFLGEIFHQVIHNGNQDFVWFLCHHQKKQKKLHKISSIGKKLTANYPC